MTSTTAQPSVLARSAPVTLGPLDISPRTARTSALAQLAAWGRADLAPDAAIVVSELVTNAVVASEQGGTAVTVRLVLTTVSVIVEVWDRAPGAPVRRAASGTADSGRGLHLVAALSRRWGWTPLPAGKCVWAELAP